LGLEGEDLARLRLELEGFSGSFCAVCFFGSEADRTTSADLSFSTGFFGSISTPTDINQFYI